MKRIILLVIAVLVVQMLPLSATEASPNNTEIGLSWHAEYYSNQYLIGPPTTVREEGALNHNWGTGSPFGDLGYPADYFTVRWTARPTLDAGNYRFTVTADDSIKLTVDYTNVVLDTMEAPRAGQTLSVDLNLSTGPHYFQLDYRELTGIASVRATLERLDGRQNPDGSVSPLPSSPSAYVTAYSLRYRSGPGLGYTILGTQPRNTVVRLIGRNADATWAKVTLPNGAQGWMSTTYLDPNVDLWSLPVVTGQVNPDGSDGSETGLMTGIVTAYALNVRSGPSTAFTIIGRLVLFTPVQILGRNEAGTWLRIRRANGALGWVSGTYVAVDANVMSLPVLY